MYNSLIKYYVSAFGRFYNRIGEFRILTYHGISESKYNKFDVSYKTFSDHIKYLSEHGYIAIKLNELAENWPDILFSKNLISITFDDGLYSSLTAAEILIKYNMTATFFITTSFISDDKSRTSLFRTQSLNNKLMNWKDIKELNDLGFEIGSHSHNHIKLAKLSEKDIYKELSTSKEILENKLSSEIISFSYPYGMIETYSKVTKRILKEVGYKIGCTQVGGSLIGAVDLLEIPRVPILSNDCLEDFILKVNGNYDCLNFTNRRWFRKLIRKY